MDFEEIIKNFRERKVLVIGDVFLDKFMLGDVERVNPEQPAAPLIKILTEKFVLGGAGNVANNISSMGGNVTLVGILGNDDYAKILSELCSDLKIKLISFYNNKPTIVKKRIMAHGQQIARFDIGEADMEKISDRVQEDILNLLITEIPKYELVLISDYNKFMLTDKLIREIIRLANDFGVKTLGSPKPINADSFRNCFAISLNRIEAEDITSVKYKNELDVLTNMSLGLSDRIKPKYIVITCGADGAFSYHDGTAEFVETVAKEVADVTGAGDTFVAALALGLSSKIDAHDSARLANYASGVAVGKVGTHAVSSQELINYINRDNHNNK